MKAYHRFKSQSLLKLAPGRHLMLAWLLAVAAFQVMAAPLQPLRVSGQEDGLRLASYAEVLEDPSRSLDLAQVRARSTGWRQGGPNAFSFGVSHSVWWVRLRLENATSMAQSMIFDLGSANPDFVHWFVLHPNGEMLLDQSSGDRLPFSSRPMQYRSLALPYRFAAGEQLELYMRVDSHDGLFELMPMSLSGEAAFAERSNREDLLLSLYHGGLLALLLYNLALFVSTRQRSFGLYVLYLAAFLCNSFSFRGFDFQYLWPTLPGLHNRMIAFSASFSFATGGLFMMVYLRLHKHAPAWLRRLTEALIGLNMAGALIGLLDYYALAAAFAFVFGMLMLLLIYFTSIWLLWRRVREARFIVLAFSALILGVLSYYMEVFDLLLSSGSSIWGMQIGSSIEMFLLAFGLADSMNSLRAQKLQAERAAREAQEALAGELAQLVSARTLELEQANLRLGELAITDELTGAFNRRHFNEFCAKTLAANTRGDSLALCMFDIDHFKAFNDRYGHQAGDAALRDVADSVSAELKRSGDCLFRLGGEEFGVLFTAASADLAQQFAERLRLAVLQLNRPHSGSPSGVLTASFGVVWWDSASMHELAPNQMYAAADGLLYEAKEGGRDRVAMKTIG